MYILDHPGSSIEDELERGRGEMEAIAMVQARNEHTA